MLLAAGCVLLAISLVLRVKITRQLGKRTKAIISGLSELAPERFPATLLTEGLYGRVRNPRYLQVIVTVAAWAMIANYLAGYAVFAATLILLPVIIRMEERELRARFGAAFDQYCARVTRLIPKF